MTSRRDFLSIATTGSALAATGLLAAPPGGEDPALTPPNSTDPPTTPVVNDLRNPLWIIAFGMAGFFGTAVVVMALSGT